MAGFYHRASRLTYPLIRFFTGLILMPHDAQKLFGWFGGRASRRPWLEPDIRRCYLRFSRVG